MIQRTFLALVLLCAPALAGGLEIGKPGGDFRLAGPAGEVTLAGLLEEDGTRAVVVWVASYTCPYSRRAEEPVIAAAPGFAERGARLVVLFPNRHETAEEMRRHGDEVGLPGLLLMDPGGGAARALGAEVTPTFYLFDKTGTLRFRGGLGGLDAALEAVLAGDEVSAPLTPATGCTIKWPESPLPETPREGVYRGPEGETPPRPEPRTGPRDAAPPGLSERGRAWLDELVAALGSEDPLVRRSAAAGIQALLPAGRQHLAELRRTAEGDLARVLDRLLSQPGGGPGARRPRGPGGDAAPGGSLLARQRSLLEENLDLAEEQKLALDAAFTVLAEREQKLRQRAEAGEREGLREDYRALLADARLALEEILTPEQLARYEELRQRLGGPRTGGGGRRFGPR